MIKSILTSIVSLTLISACAHDPTTWVIQDRPSGGIIGYRGGTGPDATAKLDRQMQRIALTRCASGRWEWGNDTVKSQERTGSSIVPVQQTTNHSGTVSSFSGGSYGSANYSGTSTTTSYQTQTYSYTDYWREIELRCMPSYAEERMSLSPKCDAGDKKSCYLVGSAYWGEQNKERAFSFWEKACSQNFDVGCARVAIEKGDKSTAERLYKKACDEDVPLGCNNLAYIKLGENTPDKIGAEALQQIVSLFQKGCNLGDEICCRDWKIYNGLLIRRLAH